MYSKQAVLIDDEEACPDKMYTFCLDEAEDLNSLKEFHTY